MQSYSRGHELPVPLTIPSLLLEQASRYGASPALVASGVTLTYAELAARAGSMGAALRDIGVTPGTRVAALMSNRIELIDLLLGCAWIGAVAVPLNPQLRGRSLAHVFEQADITCVLVEPVHADRVVEAGFGGRCWLVGDRRCPRAGVLPACDAEGVEPLDTAMILFTSGTTGLPKGVRCPHAQSLCWGESVGSALELAWKDVLYNCLPLFHTNAINSLFQAIMFGCTFVLGERFSVRSHWLDVERSGATVTYLLGAMVAMLVASPASDRDRGHTVTRALSPATPPRMHSVFRSRFGVLLIDGFGSTETNYVVGNSVSEHRPGFLGRVRPGYEAAVCDGDSPLPSGTPGELVVRSEMAGAFATGYCGEPEQDPLGWRRTGDRVVEESDGWYRFVDRVKDVIRRRGENVSSVEVEDVFGAHPDVAQVAAYPVPSTLAEDEVMLAVVVRFGSTLDPETLVRFGERDLPYFALPRFVRIVPALPLTETGKVRKSALTEAGTSGVVWDAQRAGYRPSRTS